MSGSETCARLNENRRSQQPLIRVLFNNYITNTVVSLSKKCSKQNLMQNLKPHLTV